MKIVDFNKYNYKYIWSQSMNKELKNIKNEQIEKNRSRRKHEDSFQAEEIEELAGRVLRALEFDAKGIAIPIVKIVRAFDFRAYKEDLKKELPGDISINGKTKEIYKHDKIILVKKSDALYHQRFIVAHELAHYLFEFLGSEEYEEGLEFHDNYHKDDHVTIPERRANRFAAAILMPSDSFIEQYKIAREADFKDMYTIDYLSRFFETPVDSIERRIKEVML